MRIRLEHFEDVDSKVDIKTLVTEKKDFQNTYRKLTKLNIEKKLLLDN